MGSRLLLSVLVAASLFGCQGGGTSVNKTSGQGTQGSILSLAFIDLTNSGSDPTGEIRKRYREDLSKTLPLQKSALDSAIFYALALHTDSAQMALSRVDGTGFSDSLKIVYYLTWMRTVWWKDNQRIASAYLDSVLAINPRHPQAIASKGSIMGNQGKRQEAIALFDSALAIDPTFARARWNKAVSLAHLGNVEEALAIIESELQRLPNEYYLLNLKGWLLCQQSRCEEALAFHDTSLKLNPRHITAYVDKSVTLIELGRYEEALATLESAERVEPDYIGIKYVRAQAHAHLNKRADMLGWLMNSIASDSNMREQAKHDSAFIAYKDDPDFRKLVGLD